jgi:hypothetical protein
VSGASAVIGFVAIAAAKKSNPNLGARPDFGRKVSRFGQGRPHCRRALFGPGDG